MMRSCFCAMLSVCCLTMVPVAFAQQSSSHLGAYTYRSHFQPNPGATADSGSRDGWESFPLSEDSGYDPTLGVETKNGRSAVTRAVTPHADGALTVGFVRRLNVVAGADATLRFRVKFPDREQKTAVAVSIFYGAEQKNLHASVNGSAWQTVDLKIPASEKTITAITIAADLQDAREGRIERVELADVEMHALATQRLNMAEPAALWDEFRRVYYLKRSLRPGDRLDLRIRDAAVDNAIRWSLKGPKDALIVQGNGGHLQYQVKPSDPAGVWTVHLEGKVAEATALLWVIPEKPSLLLGEVTLSASPELLGEVTARRDELRKGLVPESGNNVPFMDSKYLLPGLPSYFNIIQRPTELAQWDAVLFRTKGDIAARDEAIHLLREAAQWPQWIHPWFPAHGYHTYYPVGIVAKNVVLAGQFLGDALPNDLKRKLDAALAQQIIVPAYEEYVLENRFQFGTSNWIGHSAGGALLAAMQSDDRDMAGYALALYSKMKEHLEAVYLSDGSYGEGISYHRFDFETTSFVAAAAKVHFGQSLDRWLMHPQKYFRYATYGKGALADFGDSHVDTAPSNVFAYMAAQNNDPDLTRFYWEYRSTGAAELMSRLLWESAISRQPGKEDLPAVSTVFERRGIAVLRDSWDASSQVIAMRAGANYNHNHADQGSLFYAWNGELWLGEAGYADYYKDLNYPTYNIQAAGHNTVLVDADPESQKMPGNAVFGQHPVLSKLEEKGPVQIVSADLHSVYPTMQQYVRTLVRIKNGPLVVVDRVKASTAQSFTQVWHPEQPVERFDVAERQFMLGADGKQVRMTGFSMVPLVMTRTEAPFPLGSYEKAESKPTARPQIISFSTEPTNAATIVTVIQNFGSDLNPDWKKTSQGATLRLGSVTIDLPVESTGVSVSINGVRF